MIILNGQKKNCSKNYFAAVPFVCVGLWIKSEHHFVFPSGIWSCGEDLSANAMHWFHNMSNALCILPKHTTNSRPTRQNLQFF